MKQFGLIFGLAACVACASQPQGNDAQQEPIVFTELESFNPVKDLLYRAPAPIKIDGVISEGEWGKVPYLSEFVDIEGKEEFKPHLSTKVKIAYDDRYFYIAAELETPHLWGEFLQRDDVICLENDFELFADFSGDTHNYVEFEMNAQNTIWDLLMTKPYRDGGKCYNGFNFLDYKSAVKLNGTINNPKDIDKGWTLEVALPWEQLLQAHHGRTPTVGDQYRINFLRIEFPLKVENGKYVKDINPKYGNDIGNHWTWSPVGRIDLHSPDLYGYIQVSDKVAGAGTDTFVDKPEEGLKWMLRRLYYRQTQYAKARGGYAASLAELRPEEVFPNELLKNLSMAVTPSMYEITYDDGTGVVWHIINDGKIWSTQKQ